jgi:hypothetical protein
MASLFTYSLNDDFPSGKVNSGRLAKEIQDSAITIALDKVYTIEGATDTTVYVEFKADLPAAGKTILDGDTTDPCGGLIGAHSGEPLPSPVTSDGIPLVHLNAPDVEGGTPVVAANTWPIEQSVMWCGAGDDVTNGTVGGGTDFKASQTTTGDLVVESQFIGIVRLGGGQVCWRNCEFGDYGEFLVYAPATSNIVENTGSGAYAKLEVMTGVNMMVAPGTPGSDGPNWDINLTEKLNANVDFTKAVPVPAKGGDGFFTYVKETDTLTYTPGTGNHNLFDVDINLSMFIRRLWLIGGGQMDLTVVDNIPAFLLPQWKTKVTLHRDDAAGSNREMVWSVLISRSATV